MKKKGRILLVCLFAMLLAVSCGTSGITEKTKNKRAEQWLTWLKTVYEMYYEEVEAPSDVAVSAQKSELNIPEIIQLHLNNRVMCERYMRHLDLVKSHHIEARLDKAEIVDEKLHATYSFSESREVGKEGAERDLHDTVYIVAGLDEKGQMQLDDYCSTAHFDECILGDLFGPDGPTKPEPFAIERWTKPDQDYFGYGLELVEFYQQDWAAYLKGLE